MPITTVLDLLISYTAAAICPGSCDSLVLPSIIRCSGLEYIMTPFLASTWREWCDTLMPGILFLLTSVTHTFVSVRMRKSVCRETMFLIVANFCPVLPLYSLLIPATFCVEMVMDGSCLGC